MAGSPRIGCEGSITRLRAGMTRLSRYLLPTEKQAPADAEALSHKLLVRAGMVRQVGSGLWSWMPAGWRVHQRVAQMVRSYRDLPQILYHFQIKERDEPRPRAGVLRTREFIMKDAYTFDRDAEGLDVGYEKHREAYDRIFDRVGLEWYRVEADVGMMGGFGAHESMARCPAGE